MYSEAVELVFELGETELPIVQAARRGEFTIEFQQAHHRSDGRVLEYYGVEGVSPTRVTEVFWSVVDPFALEVLSSRGGTVCELIVEESVTTTLADQRSRLKCLTASPETCELIVLAPGHVDTSLVSATVLDTYPGSELLARRRQLTDNSCHDEQLFATVIDDLTDRQHAVLEAAVEAGYFATPREATCEEIAETLGISDSTVSEHLRVAQRKVFEHLFAEY